MSEVIDNRAHRIRNLKEIIKHLHGGQPAGEVKGRLQQIVRETDYSEIVAMEQELIAEGMPVEEIQCMCDLHSQVTREVLVQIPTKSVPPGHPADTLRRENDALRGVIAEMRKAMAEIEALSDDAPADPQLMRWRQAFNDLMDIEKHYQRKEHALFSCLERHGITGPSKVMWAKDDEVRDLLKELGAALRQPGAAAGEWKLVAASVAAAALSAIEEMFYKEEHILLPMCLDSFTDDEWAEVWASSPQYGWCLVEPRQGYQPPVPVVPDAVNLPSSKAVMLPTGNLTVEQLVGIFSTLPVDLTFVDADDRVAFFSEGPDRIFSRSKAIIGRKVQHCHPPRSVDVVDRILADFRAGRQNVAEFWINFTGKFVHIRYFAVRDAAGAYAGTLEVTQDLAPLRKLEGERRLLEYESASSAATPPPQAELPRVQDAVPAPASAPDAPPAWLDQARIRFEIDADSMLETGEHPIGKVRQSVAALQPGELVRLTSSFRPVPLIETFLRSGVAVYSVETAPRRHATYFCARPLIGSQG